MRLIIRAAYNFFFTLLKGIDDVLSFLGCVFLDQSLTSHSILFSITCTLCHRREYDEQKAVVGVSSSGGFKVGGPEARLKRGPL